MILNTMCTLQLWHFCKRYPDGLHEHGGTDKLKITFLHIDIGSHHGVMKDVLIQILCPRTCVDLAKVDIDS